ncbi:MAG: DUF4126 domain-containing protein [Candidatus Eisenbacteria bacterium]|nr:DUF4126 domain-containing protein [Candidatus Eisenbacteria bacterium]
MELALSILIGLGLSAACGYRVFVPFLVLSIAAMTGHVTLAQGFQWIGTPYALTAFAVATVLEVVAYYVPWVDNLMDAAATPAAVVAGILITASVVGDVSPFLRWSLAVIAGGGVAGAIQAATVVVRGTSSATTGGLGNPVVATGELGGSIVTSILAVLVPIAAVLLVVLLLVLIIRFARRRIEAC